MPANDHQIRLFIEVARAGSLRAAADALGLSQPALSKQVAALERTLAAPLFRRTGRGMMLTPLGQQLMDQMQGGYAQVDAAYDAVAMAAKWAGGRIGIAVVKTLAIYLMPTVVASLREHHAHLGVSLITASSSEVVERVARGHADIGLVYDQAVDSGEFTIHPLHREALCVYRAASAKGPASYSRPQLRLERLILPPRSYALRRFIEREVGPDLPVAIESNDIVVSLELAARGLGLAVLPERLPPALIAAYPVHRAGLFEADSGRLVVAITRRADRTNASLAVTLAEIVAAASDFTASGNQARVPAEPRHQMALRTRA